MAFPVRRGLTERAEARRDHYRRSSVTFPLEGYNNPATFSSSESASDSPLPQRIDMKLLECLNKTIGSAVPLADVPVTTNIVDMILAIIYYVLLCCRSSSGWWYYTLHHVVILLSLHLGSTQAQGWLAERQVVTRAA